MKTLRRYHAMYELRVFALNAVRRVASRCIALRHAMWTNFLYSPRYQHNISH